MREILFQVSAAAVLTAVVKALIPSERYDRQFRLLLSAFFISVAVGAFRGQFSSADLSGALDLSGGYHDYTVQLERQTAEEIAANLRGESGARLPRRIFFPKRFMSTFIFRERRTYLLVK